MEKSVSEKDSDAGCQESAHYVLVTTNQCRWCDSSLLLRNGVATAHEESGAHMPGKIWSDSQPSLAVCADDCLRLCLMEDGKEKKWEEALGPTESPTRHIQRKTSYNWVVSLGAPCRVAGPAMRGSWQENEVVMR